MMEFTVTPLRTNTVAYVARMRGVIRVDPPYQRQGEVWSREKQALLIDSIINQFDIPKIYFHQHTPALVEDGQSYNYSLVDGRQRLEAIWDFIDGKFPLSEDFSLLSDGSTNAAGKTYSELQQQEPDIASLFGASPLDIMLIQTNDIDLIEEMFSRLNEAVPLNAAEKRNGRGGPLRNSVRDLCQQTFFTSRLPFGNNRYRHYDLATKFLLIEDQDGPTDTKKRQLDEFWEELKEDKSGSGRAQELTDHVSSTLKIMEKTFVENDPLLSVVGMVSVYFLLYRDVAKGTLTAPMRADLSMFDSMRRLARYNSEEELSRHQRNLLEFDRLSQSPNDGGALRYRLEVLTDFLRNPAPYA